MEDTSGLTWRKARASGSNGGGCVEVGSASDGRAAGIRDTTARERGMLTVTAATFGDLLASVKRGDLDLPTRLETRL